MVGREEQDFVRMPSIDPELSHQHPHHPHPVHLGGGPGGGGGGLAPHHPGAEHGDRYPHHHHGLHPIHEGRTPLSL